MSASDFSWTIDTTPLYFPIFFWNEKEKGETTNKSKKPAKFFSPLKVENPPN